MSETTENVIRRGPRPGFRWNEQTILYAIRLWHRKHGRPPYAREWARAGEDHPTRHTVARIYGRWNKALAAAGFSPRARGFFPETHRRQ